MAELRDCPFCGNDELSMLVEDRSEEAYSIQCDECGASGPRAEAEHLADAKWNGKLGKRRPTDVREESLEAMRKAVEDIKSAMGGKIAPSAGIPLLNALAILEETIAKAEGE
jgi:Lar family restriction alleviation protein